MLEEEAEEAALMEDKHCPCGVYIGVGPTWATGTLYCTPLCAAVRPSADFFHPGHQAMAAIITECNMSVTSLAAQFHMTPQHASLVLIRQGANPQPTRRGPRRKAKAQELE